MPLPILAAPAVKMEKVTEGENETAGRDVLKGGSSFLKITIKQDCVRGVDSQSIHMMALFTGERHIYLWTNSRLKCVSAAFSWLLIMCTHKKNNCCHFYDSERERERKIHTFKHTSICQAWSYPVCWPCPGW